VHCTKWGSTEISRARVVGSSIPCSSLVACGCDYCWISIHLSKVRALIYYRHSCVSYSATASRVYIDQRLLLCESIWCNEFSVTRMVRVSYSSPFVPVNQRHFDIVLRCHQGDLQKRHDRHMSGRRWLTWWAQVAWGQGCTQETASIIGVTNANSAQFGKFLSSNSLSRGT
jgi:hypothetical protein